MSWNRQLGSRLQQRAAVVPSLWPEPQRLVAIEATVRGVPVIASQAGGVGEIVDEGITGLRFPNGAAQGLDECLWMIAERRAFPDQRVAAAAVRRVAESFSVETNVANWRRIFREVIGD